MPTTTDHQQPTMAPPLGLPPELADWRRPPWFDDTAHTWMVSSARDVMYVIDNPRLFSTQLEDVIGCPRDQLRFLPPPLAGMSFTTGQHHRALRDLVAAPFTVRAVARRDDVLAALAHLLADDVAAACAADGQVDIVATFCRRLPYLTMCGIFGFTPEQVDDLERDVFGWMNEGTPTVMNLPKTMTGAWRRWQDLIDTRRAELASGAPPRPGLLDHMLLKQQAGYSALWKITDDDLGGMLGILFTAGVATTAGGLASIVASLLFERTWEALVEGLRFAGSSVASQAAFSIMLRDPPFPIMRRVATEDVTLPGGQVIPAGQHVTTNFIGAQHDPGLRLGTTLDQQWAALPSWNGGTHRCLGMPLAKAELIHGTIALASRFPDLRLVELGTRTWPSIVPSFESIMVAV